MSSLSNKIALVTGSSKGIGASIARKLAARGATLVINYASSRSDAEAVVASLPRPESHLVIQADVSKVSECQRLVAETVEKYGRVDILILNAGWMPSVELSNTTEETFDRIFNTNVKGPWFLTQAAAPHIPTDGTGRVIFMSTSLTGANTVTPNYTLYISTKGAIEQMTRGIGKDLGRKNISVNVVSPGPTATDLFFQGKTPELIERFKSMNPRGKIGEPDDVAEAVVFLSSPESSWVSGQNLRVNGGFV